MKAKQISLDQRVELAQAGLPADRAGLLSILEKSASAPLSEFFCVKRDYFEFLDIVRDTMGRDMELPQTYQDGAAAAYALFFSKERPEQSRSLLLNLVKGNYVYFYEKVYGLEDQTLMEEERRAKEEEKGDGREEKAPRQLPLEERIRHVEGSGIGCFPAIQLPVCQLYLGTSLLTRSYYPAALYRDEVNPLIHRAMKENKKMKPTVVDMAIVGCAGNGKPDWDTLFMYTAVIPYLLMKEAKEDFKENGE